MVVAVFLTSISLDFHSQKPSLMDSSFQHAQMAVPSPYIHPSKEKNVHVAEGKDIWEARRKPGLSIELVCCYGLGENGEVAPWM